MLRQNRQESRGNGAANTAQGGIRKRRRHMRSILQEGLEAAMRADPQMLEKCTPKTGYGAFIRGLVLEAAKCKATPTKTLMSLVDWEPHEDEDTEDALDPARRDWSPEGEWETMPEPEPEEEPAKEAEHPARAELKRRLYRLVEAGQHEHAARIVEAIRAGACADPEPISTG